MRVSCITPVVTRTYNNVNNKQGNNYPTFKAGLVSDAFIKGQIPFDKLKKFTIEEYSKLSKSEIKTIDEMIRESFLNGKLSSDFYKYLEYNDIAAAAIKNSLENKFGAGNFIVIPVGRSLSSIGKCLGYKIGEDNVKQLPLSGAVRFINIENRNEDFGVFCRYLSSIGLSKNKIRTSGKKYIFTDYCNSGASLLGTKRLFTSEKVYGDLDNLEFIDVHELLSGIEPAEVLEKIENKLMACRFKVYSLVEKCHKLSNTRYALIKPEEYAHEAKCFYFKLLDNEMKRAEKNL